MTMNGLKQIFSIKDISQKQLTRLLKKANNNPTKSLDDKIAQLKKAKKQINGLQQDILQQNKTEIKQGGTNGE